LLFGAKKYCCEAKALHQENQPLRSGLLNLNEAKCTQWTPERGCYRRKNQKKIHKIILNDRKVKFIEIAETLKISKERVGNIVFEYLDMRKLWAKWVPRVLTIDQKQQRVDDSEQC
jgi:hypothetical protein